MTQKKESVYPYWRLRVTQNVPMYLIQAFHLHNDGYYEVYSIEAIQAFLRTFLQNPQDTKIRGPLQLEVLHISHEDSLSKEEREITDRAVYHIDFRQGKHYLLGHNHFQPEIQHAWEMVGGCFARIITELDREKRPMRQRFIPPPKPKRDG